MKIGIMTTHNALNCGAILQAYAMQTFLQSLGHEPEFIDFRERKRPLKIRDFIGKGLKKTINKCADQYFDKVFNKNEVFMKDLKVGSQRYSSLQDLQEHPPSYDVYLAGSDQIWTVASRKEIPRPYYLDFGPISTKRISYAASLGQGLVPKHMENDMRNALLKLDHISVREANGAEYVRSLVGDKKEVHHVIDPTLLLTQEKFAELASKVETGDQEYLICYSLAAYGKEEQSIVNYIQEKFSLIIKNLRNPSTCIRLPNAENIIVTPGQWLAYLKSARLIICTSFHAVVFSLIFHKAFIVVSPYANQRIISLLDIVGLEDFFLSGFEKERIDYLLEKNIDWSEVDARLAKSRESSIEYLLNSLKA